MTPLLERLRQRKLGEWALAYLAGAFFVVQLLDGLEGPLGLTRDFQLVVLLLLILGFPIALVVAWFHGEEGRQQVSGVEILLIALVVAAGAFGLSTMGGGDGQVPTFLDPNHIAVMPFTDASGADELEGLTRGVTTNLIAELDGVSALEVVPVSAVDRYRGEPVPSTQIAADLRVGSVVTGSLQRFADSLVVFVQLVDGESGSTLDTRVLRRPYSDGLALPRDLAAEIATALRQRIGREVRTRRLETGGNDPEARSALQQASELREDARTLRAYGDSVSVASAHRRLDRADSLVEIARRSDPDWPEPVLLQGWLLVDRIGLPYVSDPERTLRLAERGIELADLVLEMDPRSRARGLELRGVHRVHLVRSTSDPAQSEEQMRLAERDLREAVQIGPNLPAAWNALSGVLWFRGEFAEAALTGTKALEADAYLEDADDAVYRLFYAYLQTAQFDGAERWCDRGRADFPTDWRFEECRLTLMAYGSVDPGPDIEAAHESLRRVEALSPPEVRDARAGDWLFRLSAVLARAGEADSAQVVLETLRDARMSIPEHRTSFLHEEAYIRLLLGERERSLELLAEYVERAPQYRSYLAGDVAFLTLRDDPRFRALLNEPEPRPSRR